MLGMKIAFVCSQPGKSVEKKREINWTKAEKKY